MKYPIEELFKKSDDPNIGAIVTLMHIMNKHKYSRKEILKAFNKLVPREEYEQNEKRQIVDNLVETSQKLT